MAESDDLWVLWTEHGFVGEEMSLADAMEAAAAPRARLLPVPAKYRHPIISGNEAMSIATPELEHRVLEWPSLHFGPVKPWGENGICFFFVCQSQEWLNEGRAPGGIMCDVDKVDGHVWTRAEWHAFYKRIGRRV